MNNSKRNKRSHERKSVAAEAIIVFENIESACILRDISFGGAKVEARMPAGNKMPVNLKLKNQISIGAKVAWRQGNFHGLKFDPYPARVGKLLMAIATYAWNFDPVVAGLMALRR